MTGPRQGPTDVVFRVWPGKEGGVIALFPGVDEGGGRCSSYEHVGQHAPADYAGCVARTRPAEPAEYMDLVGELKRAGYVLDIRRRRR